MEPFPDLIELDCAQARERLPGLQELCERVLLHTDGKGDEWGTPALVEFIGQGRPGCGRGIGCAEIISELQPPLLQADESDRGPLGGATSECTTALGRGTTLGDSAGSDCT